MYDLATTRAKDRTASFTRRALLCSSYQSSQLADGSPPQLFHAVDRSAHSFGDFGEAQAFAIPQLNDLSIVRRQLSNRRA
jgi:hypothetical protein